MIGGASGRARNWRGRLLRSAVIPATLRGCERAGLGSFGRDFSAAEIGRVGVEAMHVVVERLGIDAEHVIFGHIHRRGAPAGRGRPWPRPTPTGSGAARPCTTPAAGSTTPAMLGAFVGAEPVLARPDDLRQRQGPPETVELLADAQGPDELELAGLSACTRCDR